MKIVILLFFTYFIYGEDFNSLTTREKIQKEETILIFEENTSSTNYQDNNLFLCRGIVV